VVTDPARFTHVDPAAPIAPWLWISGAAAADATDVPLAIVVNGVVAATTRTVGTEGPAAWWAPLPPQFFHAGANDVEVDEIRGPPSSPALVPGAS
jgi:hypothetical protein